ncbi:hypothetical protein Tco_0231855 [Tanacetum coccineum]
METLPTYCLTALYILVVHCPSPYQLIRTYSLVPRSPYGTIKLTIKGQDSSGVITVYPEEDPFDDDSEKTENSMDDWYQLLDFNFEDIPQLDGEELPLFVCKMGKSSRNKKRAMENLNFFYPDIGTSSSIGRHLTQEEAAKEALALRIS